MKLLSKKDIVYAIVTGLIGGILGAMIFIFLRQTLPFGIMPAWLVIIVPICWLAGVQLGYFLGKWIGFFDQFGKFAAIGFTNFAVDAAILNLLMFVSGVSAGLAYSVFKIISFMIAVCHSYFWNRTWAFESKGSFTKFILVMIASMIVNVGIASLIVNFVPHSATAEVWANVGVVVGAASALIFSFIGFKVIVFKK